MEYYGKFGHALGRIQHIAFMGIIYICYTAYLLENKIVAPTLTVFQGLMRCIQYLTSHPYKPIFYSSDYYDGINVIRLTYIGN